MNQRLFLFVFIAAVLLGGVWIWLNRVADPTASADQVALPLVGYPAPDFTLTTLAGDELTLSELRGKPVVLNFWASWCGPCEAEMPELQQAFEDKAAGGLVVVGVNQGEQAAVARDFTGRLGLSFPVALDERLLAAQEYGVSALPTSFFIDRDGIIRDQIVGQLNTALLEQRLRLIYP